MLGLQMSSSAIVHAVCTEYGISERMAYKDIRAAFALLELDDAQERDSRRAQIRHSLQMLYRRCLKRADFRGAGFALDRLCKLDGLYPSDGIHSRPSNADPNIESLPPDVADALRKALQAIAPGGDLRALAGLQ
jgi:hypothetical protein